MLRGGACRGYRHSLVVARLLLLDQRYRLLMSLRLRLLLRQLLPEARLHLRGPRGLLLRRVLLLLRLVSGPRLLVRRVTGALLLPLRGLLLLVLVMQTLPSPLLLRSHWGRRQRSGPSRTASCGPPRPLLRADCSTKGSRVDWCRTRWLIGMCARYPLPRPRTGGIRQRGFHRGTARVLRRKMLEAIFAHPQRNGSHRAVITAVPYPTPRATHTPRRMPAALNIRSREAVRSPYPAPRCTLRGGWGERSPPRPRPSTSTRTPWPFRPGSPTTLAATTALPTGGVVSTHRVGSTTQADAATPPGSTHRGRLPGLRGATAIHLNVPGRDS